MSLFQVGESWAYQDLQFQGVSLSGIRTAVMMPELQLSFDVAQGFPFLIPMKKFFLTHGHQDHAAGLPYLISQRNLFHMPAADFYMPPSLLAPMTNIIHEWEKIEQHQYKYRFHPVQSGEEISLNAYHFVRPFLTYHRIESFGYTVFKRTKRLAARFAEASREEIVEARRRGETVNETIDTPLVSFTGDTKIEFLDGPEWVRKSKVLMLESTYIDERKSVSIAREWGHTHLDEIIPRLDQIEAEQIVLIHVSSRYSNEEAKQVLQRRIPREHLDRVILFPGR